MACPHYTHFLHQNEASQSILQLYVSTSFLHEELDD